MKLFLFGLLGCGKSYVGRILQEEFDFALYDADLDLTAAMKDAIGNYQEFTTPMRDKYYEIVMNRFADLTRKQEKLVIVQALFKNRHRRKILIRFPEIRLIWVQSDLEQIRRRLEARANHLAGQSYGALINKHFELPTVPHQVLINNGGREEVLKQIRAVVGPAHQVVHQ